MFYEIYINLKKETLTFRMKLLTRLLSSIFFISMLLMIIFDLSKEEFREYFLFQKILFFIILFLSFLGTFYQDTIAFYKKDKKIQIKKGLIFLYRKYNYSFDDLDSIFVKKILKRPNYLFLDFNEKYIFMFGFKIKGKYIIIENRLDEPKLIEFIKIFKSFFPRNIEQVNL